MTTQLTQQVQESLRRATKFLQQWSTGGGYPGGETLDGNERWGESLTHHLSPSEIWIQPPGTSAVGEVFLRAYRATKEKVYLDAAVKVGRALELAQRKAGGWYYTANLAEPQSDGPCTLDDNTTQAALQFLMHLEVAIRNTSHPPAKRSGLRVTRAVNLGLAYMLTSQLSEGGWPHTCPLPGTDYDYRRVATFNDGVINDCIKTMLEAHQLYGNERYLKSAMWGGYFIIASQVFSPQRGWPQQCDKDMKPVWGRHFEPPAVCSAVTARCIRSLIELQEQTGDSKWLAPIPAAIDWLERSQGFDGLWPRFCELNTNRALYAENYGKYYHLFQISDERRTHYAWRGTFGIPAAIRAWEKIGKARQEGLQILKIVNDQDDQGRWVDNQKLHTKTFVDKMGKLLDFLEVNP